MREPLAGGAIELLGCFDADANFTLALSESLDWSGHWLIHVYDSTYTDSANLSIGAITIAGAPTGLTSLGVRVAAPTQVWEEVPNNPLLDGCINLGGLTIEDESTRAKTRVSVAVSGDINGDIHANQLVRIQANGRNDPENPGVVLGGVIVGSLTADGGPVVHPCFLDNCERSLD